MIFLSCSEVLQGQRRPGLLLWLPRHNPIAPPTPKQPAGSVFRFKKKSSTVDKGNVVEKGTMV